MGKGGGGRFRGTKGGRQNHGTPRNNRAQNEQTNSIARILKLTHKQREELHRLVHGMNMGYQEMLEYAREWFKK